LLMRAASLNVRALQAPILAMRFATIR
jgi:hypothetical protein